ALLLYQGEQRAKRSVEGESISPSIGPLDTQGAHGEIQVKTVPISALIGLSAVRLVSFSVDA
ncbi:hypothetical protein J7J45_04270, partial [Candidatus Aerophobetes bacterium]|nr:hypothetical protein [Candidatus Aerophobetes bacterium]